MNRKRYERNHISYDGLDIHVPVMMIWTDFQNDQDQDSIISKVSDFLGFSKTTDRDMREAEICKAHDFIVECLLGQHPEKEIEIWQLVRAQVRQNFVHISHNDIKIVERLNINTAGFYLLSMIIALDSSVTRSALSFVIDKKGESLLKMEGETKIKITRAKCGTDDSQIQHCINISVDGVSYNGITVTIPLIPETLANAMIGNNLDKLVDCRYFNGLDIKMNTFSHSEKHSFIDISDKENPECLDSYAQSMIDEIQAK